MTAVIIDGKQLAQNVRTDWKLRAERLNALGIVPGLAVVMVGENPASQVYVRNKIKACRKAGTRGGISVSRPHHHRHPMRANLCRYQEN